MKKIVLYMLLPFAMSSISTGPSEGSPAARFEQIWKQKQIGDYLLKGSIVMFRSTRYFETRVKAGQAVAYQVNGAAAPMEEAITVDFLFSLVNKTPSKNEYVEVRDYDKQFGIPEWVGWGRRDITDAGGYIRIGQFIPNPESYQPPETTYHENYIVEDFDGLRLLLRKGDQIFVQSLENKQLVPVADGLVPGGSARLSGQYVVWSNLRKENYFLSAKNLVTGETKRFTDEKKDACFSFLCNGPWLAWRNSRNRQDTINLMNLERGANTVVSKIFFITMDRNAILRDGRLFWMDEKGTKIFMFKEGKGKATFDVSQVSCNLLGYERDDLYYATQSEGSCVKDSGKRIIQYNLKTGSSQMLKARVASPWKIVMGDSVVSWIDRRDGVDEVFGYDLKDGTERQISYGSGHRHILFMAGNRVIWDDNRYGLRALHCYDWLTGKDEILWTTNPPVFSLK